jgi:2-polyprenyl-6-methoxyphenol hydroxylase-like FAD-dependent oxidoreductase
MAEGRVAVLIVGAGPVGLALAIGLRARGVDVLVVDAREAPASEVRASHLHARPLETLEHLGVVDRLLASGRRDLGASVCAGTRVLSSIDLEGVETRWPFSLAVPQPEIERIFAARLSGWAVTA